MSPRKVIIITHEIYDYASKTFKIFEEDKIHCSQTSKAPENSKTPIASEAFKDKAINSYRSFYKYTNDCINDDTKIIIDNKTLLELREKIDFYRTSVNELKAKMNRRDSRIFKFTEKLRTKLSAQQFSSIEKDIVSIPGNYFF